MKLAKLSLLGGRVKSGRPGCRSRRCRLSLTIVAILGALASGCSSGKAPATTNPDPAPNPQGSSKLYFAPSLGDVYASTYSIDHSANSFVRKVYGFNNSPANGATVTDSGIISKLSNGVLSLETAFNESGTGTTTTYNPPLKGSWAVEIPGQAGLVGMRDYTNFTPIVPTGSCPNLAKAETLLFVTIPNHLSTNATTIAANSWNPQMETAFGTVDVTTDGTSVQFLNVKQFAFPASDGQSAALAYPGPGSATSVCSPTFYGQTMGVPVTVDVIDPGTTETVPPSATIGIGPSGFLVEDAGSSQIQGEPYENILGAGFGAIGLPTPSGPIGASILTGARFQGFLYGSGGPVNSSESAAGFSFAGSFGYQNLKASCPALPAPANGTTIFGGEYEKNDPSAHASGNCDVAIDLGKQDASKNGLYKAAKVYVASSFPTNTTGKVYSFPAVAIAGQISGKLAIFLIGTDLQGAPQQAWGIYLLQTN